MAKPSAAKAIFIGGLIAGAFDITYACTFFGFRNHVSPIRILQSVARGALGNQAFQGGLKTAALGLFFHFLIALNHAGQQFILCKVARGFANHLMFFGELEIHLS